MKEMKLLPCPFPSCGSTDIVWNPKINSMYCKGCETAFQQQSYTFNEKESHSMLNNWNTRPEPVKRVDVEGECKEVESDSAHTSYVAIAKILHKSAHLNEKNGGSYAITQHDFNGVIESIGDILQKSRPDGRVIEEVLEIIKNEHTYYRDQCDGYRALSNAMNKIKSKLTKGGG